MKYDMFSVKDELTGKFMSPMFTEKNDLSESLAIRQFKTQVNTIELWKDNCSDYSLYRVGVFDDENGAESCVIEKIIGGRSVVYGG